MSGRHKNWYYPEAVYAQKNKAKAFCSRLHVGGRAFHALQEHAARYFVHRDRNRRVGVSTE